MPDKDYHKIINENKYKLTCEFSFSKLVQGNKIIMKKMRYKAFTETSQNKNTENCYLSSLNSPKENRVEYKRYLNELNDTLQSMITAGKLKRMQYITINNRAMFNRAKIQRSEWISQKFTKNGGDSFSPETSNLRLDNRSAKIRPRKNNVGLRVLTEVEKVPPIRKINNEKDLLDSLIDEQIQQMKRRKQLKTNYDRKKIVQKACQQIQNRLLSIPIHNLKAQHPKNDKSPVLKTQRKNLSVKKDHKRSVTQNLYQTSLQNIKKKEQVEKKERYYNRKYFVRKLQKINAHVSH